MIINLTQHQATPDQIEAGVVDVDDRARLSRLLTVQVGGPDGFAALSRSTWPDYLHSLAWAITSEFVLPAVAAATRRHFLEAGALESDIAALNARKMPTVPVMVGGFAPLMSVLVPLLREHGAEPMVALSDRVSVDESQPDGTVRKITKFKHMGFHPA